VVRVADNLFHLTPKSLRLNNLHSVTHSKNKRNYLELSWKSTTYADRPAFASQRPA
jgi:hypothetical protein